ncbi:SseB family protein [Nocardiopsis potens]|uniref:SseB family protein n=1 Tax=Nocardiopsis potens TaxID=1246458 RepID=UPI00037288D0|nr:SseB family protein [Nocardiopsis potens]
MTSHDSPAGYGPGFPANPVEQALLRVLEADREDPEDTAPDAAFLEALGAGRVWVPVPEGSGRREEDGAVALPSLELDGAVFIPVFTSQEQYEQRSGDIPCAVLDARDLAQVLPEGVGLAVNPGNAAGLPVPPEAVPALASA